MTFSYEPFSRRCSRNEASPCPSERVACCRGDAREAAPRVRQVACCRPGVPARRTSSRRRRCAGSRATAQPMRTSDMQLADLGIAELLDVYARKEASPIGGGRCPPRPHRSPRSAGRGRSHALLGARRRARRRVDPALDGRTTPATRRRSLRAQGHHRDRGIRTTGGSRCTPTMYRPRTPPSPTASPMPAACSSPSCRRSSSPPAPTP